MYLIYYFKNILKMYFEVYNKHRNSTEAGKLEVVSFIYREKYIT